MSFIRGWLTWQHWFSNSSLPMQKINFVVVMAVAGVFILLAIICLALRKKEQKKKNIVLARLTRRFFNFFLTLGLALGLIVFFRYQRIPVLGMRFWYLLWLISAIVWLVFILRYWFRKAPREKMELEEDARFKRYLP